MYKLELSFILLLVIHVCLAARTTQRETLHNFTIKSLLGKSNLGCGVKGIIQSEKI